MCEAGQTGSEEQRRHGENWPTAGPLDLPSDAQRDQSSAEQAERGAGDDIGQGPSGLGLDGRGEDGDQVESRSPGEDLVHAQNGNDDEWAGLDGHERS